ncbi:MAG TPA: type II secretion system F family protein [Candidatus Omnitrophota bacterium]|nr:type II secretion system F family protein [Candidatus Omnitrophota bacterium]HPS37293.1 type II secretion system F family protein [Candidatus Omnitrophota bacterium]
MKQFRYQAKKGTAHTKGILSAETKDAAIDKINEMGLVPVELVEEGVQGQKNLVFSEVDLLLSKVGKRALTVFYRQLGRLIRSGVPLLPALAVAEEQSEEVKFRAILELVKNKVRQGKSLAVTMSEHASIFNPFAIAMVELGENTGRLDEALLRLADCIEREAATFQKVRNALIYPAFVAILGTSAFVFLLGYVVPKFSKLFSELGQNLPLLTKGLIAASGFVQVYGLWLALALGFLIMIFNNRLRIRAFRISWDRAKLKLPMVGRVIFMSQFAAFARSMETLLKGGVPLLKALRITLPVVSNAALREELIKVTSKVEQGAALSGSLKSSGMFPIFAVHLLLIGEQTGHMDQSFNDVADWYEQEVVEQTRIMTQLIEPVTILVIGALLGVVAMAILLPVFSMDAIIL